MAPSEERAQADLKIENFLATENVDTLEFKFSVTNPIQGGGDDTARMVRVIVLLPVNVRVKNVNVEEKKTGFGGYEKSNNCTDCDKCEVYWNSSVVISRTPGNHKPDHENLIYDTSVSIDLAYLDRGETAEITVTTSIPKLKAIKKIFGAFVYGSVPDPDPKSNYITAEC